MRQKNYNSLNNQNPNNFDYSIDESEPYISN